MKEFKVAETKNDQPVWISHRGLKEEHVENTVGAFRAAVAAGFQWLETDLRCTSDDRLVLLHDPNLERLAGLDAKVAGLPAAAIKALQLAGGERVMFFDEFMDEFAGLNWTFDIKPEGGLRTVAAFTKWVEERNAREWVTAQAKFLVWDRRQERQLRTTFPDARYYAPRKEIWRAGVAVLAGLPSLGGIQRGRIYALPPKLGAIDLYQAKYMQPFHDAGAKVLAFLPETETEIRAAIASGVDEILSDHSFEKLRGHHD